MSGEAVDTARKRLSAAAEDLDANQVAALMLDLAAEAGVASVWEQVCVPLLGALPGRTASEVVETLVQLTEGGRTEIHHLHRRVLALGDGHQTSSFSQA